MPITVTTGGPIVAQQTRKSILEIIQEACAEPGMGIRVPAAVFASTQREHIELKALALKMATAIAFDDNYDWSGLKVLATLTGDGTETEFDFPVGYRRMLKKAALWPNDQIDRPLRHIPDVDRWLGTARLATWPSGEWTIIGDQIVVRPAIPAGQTVSFYYITNLYAYDATSAPQPTFTADDDMFRLDADLLKLGIVWRWKAAKGQPYAEDLADYETAKASLVAGDRGSVILTGGRPRTSFAASPAYPWPLGQ